MIDKDVLETLDPYDQGRIDTNERNVDAVRRGI